MAIPREQSGKTVVIETVCLENSKNLAPGMIGNQ
jgi:hypothetical protein